MRRRGTRGTSLLEVLSAVSLFSLTASGVGALATSSLRNTIRNQHGTAAAMLVQQQLENLRGLDYADVLPGSTSTTVAGLSYTIATNVLTDSPAAGMKTITVTVTWMGPEGSHSYAVQTIYTSITS